MAPQPSSHQFQKLKLDSHAPVKPVASTFAALSRHGALHTTAPPVLDGVIEGKPLIFGDDRRGRCQQDGFAVGYDDDGCHDSHHEGIDIPPKNRSPSVSFGDVKVDGGSCLSLGEPLPRYTTVRGCSPDSDGEWSDQDFVMISIDRKKRDHRRHRVGEPRYPLLQSTVNELAEEEPQDHDRDHEDHVASLTSQTTASPPEDELRTPPEPRHMLSPAHASSPIEFPSPWSRKTVPRRTRSYRGEVENTESFGRRSRKGSTRSPRSAQSSMSSTARSFLDMYKSSRNIKPPEPDDEGQGIGYNGEYIIGKQIGFGGFSVVKEVTTLEDGRSVVFAVKIVRKQVTGRSELENEQLQTQFDHEVEIWRFLRHPYILPLLRVYNSEFATYCITQLNKGGTLFDVVRDTRRQKKKGLDGHLAKRYTYQLASALRYLHNDVMVVHRDIKLENCLVDMTGPDAEEEGGDLLLCDFGMADFVVSDQRDGPEPFGANSNHNIGPAETSTCVAGSLLYIAPELFDASGPVYSTAADMWAFGVVVYTLLTSHYPFKEGLDAQTIEKIKNGDWDEELLRSADAVHDGGVDDALALVRGCLELRPEKRWTVNDVLECSWLKGCTEKYEHVHRPWTGDLS